MSVESQDRALVGQEVKDALLGATETGVFLAMAQVRELDDGALVADVYSEDGKVIATYALEVVVGARIEQP